MTPKNENISPLQGNPFNIPPESNGAIDVFVVVTPIKPFDKHPSFTLFEMPYNSCNDIVMWRGEMGNSHTGDTIEQSHIPYNAPVPYPTMHNCVAKMCLWLHIADDKWCILGYLSDALWDSWDGSVRIWSRVRSHGIACSSSTDSKGCLSSLD